MSDLLLTKISTVRARHRSVALATGASLAVLALVAALGIGMLLDWWLDLPRWVRAAFLVIDVGLLGYILFRDILKPLLATPDDDDVALRVEAAHPQFASRLIAAVQLSRPEAVPAGASVALVRATVAQAEMIAREIDFPEVIPTDRFTKFMFAAVLAAVTAAIAFGVGAHDRVSTDLLARAFLSDVPVPRKTRITVTSGDLRLGKGDTALLAATARGVIPARGTTDVRFDSGRKQSFPIEPTPENKTAFVRPLENVQDSFDYRVHLGDNTSPWFHATVLTPPVVTQLDVQQVYPPYTKLQPVTRSLGDLSVLTGSHLLLKVTSNNPLQPDSLAVTNPGNAVHLVNATTQPAVRLVVDPNDPHHATADVPLPPKTTGFSVHLRDTNGLISKESTVYRVDLTPDKPPTVRVTYPTRQEELVTRVATLEIGFDAADDFGIARLALHYKIDDGPEQSIPLDIGNASPRTLHNRYAWKISRLTPPAATKPTLEGSSIEYWLEAEDNNNVTGPSRGSSEHYSAKVVSEAEKKAEIFARMGASIQDVQRGVQDEQKLHKDLGDLILEKPRQEP
jgi:hypothetical protein